jgi:hypothetical protein
MNFIYKLLQFFNKNDNGSEQLSVRFLQLKLFQNIAVGYRDNYIHSRMRFGYLVMIIMLSIASVNSYNQRPFNPQKKKPFIASKKMKVTKPYVPSKGPRSNLPYRSEYVNKKSKKEFNKDNNNEDELPFWSELLEGDR